ncbi:MAG: PTS fructose transporter subunit IIC [Clostridiales bacterium]|nr:PTS fructose transporter subunit IIC [Clostridiales bacterium]
MGKNSFLDHILNGIKYMLPCVVAGGILMGAGYMLDDISINPSNYGYNTPIASFFSTTGHAAFEFMLPMLAAFIGCSISGTSAIAAGLAGGYLSSQGNSGFLGALAAGFIAGHTVGILERLLKKLPSTLNDVKTLLLYPLLSVTVMGAFSFALLEPVMGAANGVMGEWLKAMSGTSKILLGIVLGAMTATDMGGPINKTAYLFACVSMSNGQYDAIAAVLAAGIVPPYATALASTIFKGKFTKKQRQNGFANYIIGLAGITEAAIPFLADDPVRVVVSCMIGSGLAGGLSMAFGCSVMAPFGGFFILPLNSNILGFVVSMGSGILTSSLIFGFLKKKAVLEK